MTRTDPPMSREDAAAARRAVRRPADRPTRRRSVEVPSGERERPRVAASIHSLVAERRDLSGPGDSGDAAFLGAAAGGWSFAGMASVTGRDYDMWDVFGGYVESVEVGAFEESLSRVDLDVPLVVGHDQLRRIARTTSVLHPLTLTEVVEGTVTGLRVQADHLDPSDVDVAAILPKVRSGLIDEMSFAFHITEGWWNDDFTHFKIVKADIHRGDVAIVGYGANPYTTADAARGDDLAEAVRVSRLLATRALLL